MEDGLGILAVAFEGRFPRASRVLIGFLVEIISIEEANSWMGKPSLEVPAEATKTSRS